MPSSILIFELNRKFLLYKILTDELGQILKDEIIKNFGFNYVAEKQKLNDDTSTTERENSASEESHINDQKFELTHDLIYEFFSPLVASFEITKDINYVFEYALFKKTNYIIRFNVFNNCLIMCILKSDPCDSEISKLIYSDYYSSWYLKSLISLLKYKYGICSDEKCFTSSVDIKKLYQKWSNLFMNDPIYHIEAIEHLQVNEDIKIKCETFLNELIQILIKTETIMSEFDYMDESYDSLRSNYDDDDLNSNDNLLFQSDEIIRESHSQAQQQFRFNELESFFTDLTQINQFVLTCGNKLLYKFKLDADRSPFSIDSSSLFILILEAAAFLDCNTSNAFAEDESDGFKSVSTSPVAKSLVDSVESDKQIEKQIRSATSHSDYPTSMNSLGEHFQSVYSTPLTNIKFNESFIDQETKDEVSLNTRGTKFKKTNCFLKTANNKSLGYYEVLLLKLSDNLCLTMIKSNKLTKYCELISDFDNLLIGLNDLLNRKRLQLSFNETNSSLANDSEIKINSKRSSHMDKIDKAFFSFFMNKLINFFDKLRQLKTDLNNSKETNSKERNILLSFKFKSRRDTVPRQPTQRSTKEELMKRNSIKLIHTLQVKLTQLTTRNEFKQFVTFINDENDSVIDSNEMLANLRQIESQVGAIRSNNTELFYELFLAHSTYLTDEIESYEKLARNLRQDSESKRSSSSSSTTNTILFKSAYLVDNIKELYRQHIYDYIPFIEVKRMRNMSMMFFCNLYPGLLHFSFINRQDNTGVIPTVDTNEKFNMDETKINSIYKKYVPIIYTFFTKYQSTQFMFHDDKLQIVFSYVIWFEDKKSNQLPIDFSIHNNDYFKMNRGFLDQTNLANSTNNLVDKTNNQLVNSPGITNKNNYDVLQNICYPNAPINSLTCYELYSIHSPQLDEDKVKFQIKSLMNSLTKRTKNGSFEFY